MNESTKQVEAASYATTASEAWNWNESQLAELNRHLDKPFGEVERFNQALAFVLWKSGYPIGRMTGGQWHECNPGWNDEARYRLLPRPEPLVLPSIDWSHVEARWKWLTQDDDGELWLHAIAPNQRGRDWMSAAYLPAVHFTSTKPGTGDWKKLIAQRPEVV